MTARVSCPFCNTAISLPGTTAGDRVQCPRCGETFAVKASAAGHHDPGQTPIPAMSRNGDATTLTPPPRAAASSSPPLGLIGVGLAALILVVGLFLVFRGGEPATDPTGDAPPKELVTMPPAAVPGLAYLPADTSVAVALQPGPMLVYCGRTGTEPRQLLASFGVPDTVFATLEKLGLKLDQIDHLAAGLVLDPGSIIPRVVVVLALHRPLDDEDRFLDGLGAADRSKAADGSTRYKVRLGGVPMLLTAANPRTYVIATDGKDLDAVGKLAGRGSGHLSAGVRESMQKLSPASVAWAATDSQKWAENPSVKALAAVLKKPDLTERLTNLRAAAVGVALEPDPQLALAVRGADTATAKLEGPFARFAAAKKGTVATSGDWIAAEVPFDPKAGATGLTDVLGK